MKKEMIAIKLNPLFVNIFNSFIDNILDSKRKTDKSYNTMNDRMYENFIETYENGKYTMIIGFVSCAFLFNLIEKEQYTIIYKALVNALTNKTPIIRLKIKETSIMKDCLKNIN